MRPSSSIALDLISANFWSIACYYRLGVARGQGKDTKGELTGQAGYIKVRSLLCLVSLPHRDGLPRTEGYALHAACALRREHREDGPVPGWHSWLPLPTWIGSEHLFRAAIQTQPTVQRVPTSLGIDLYLHRPPCFYHGNLAKSVLGFRVIAPLSQTARQTPQP